MLSFVKRKIKSVGRRIKNNREIDRQRKQAQAEARARREQLQAEAQARKKRIEAKMESKRKAIKAKHQLLQEDMEVAKKYIVKRSEKALFAEDMGQRKTNGKVAIPKTITLNGTTYSKYTSYEQDLWGAQEAAGDLQELGYKTFIKMFQRGSEPVYVLYRYKKGTTSNSLRNATKNTGQIKRKTPAKRRTRAKRYCSTSL